MMTASLMTGGLPTGTEMNKTGAKNQIFFKTGEPSPCQGRLNAILRA